MLTAVFIELNCALWQFVDNAVDLLRLLPDCVGFLLSRTSDRFLLSHLLSSFLLAAIGFLFLFNGILLLRITFAPFLGLVETIIELRFGSLLHFKF